MNTLSRKGLARRALAMGVGAGLVLSGLAGTAAAQDEPVEQIENGTFADGTSPWWWTESASASLVDGRLCAEVTGGTVNPWDAIVGQDGVALVAGQSYRFSFTASASVDTTVRANIQLPTAPYTALLSENPALTSEPGEFTYSFTSDADVEAQVAFQIGGNAEPYTFCLDDVSLTGGPPPPEYEPDTGPRVRVNQMGYLPDGPKRATLVTDATEPVPWQVRDSAGTVVASGMSSPEGIDPTSELTTHEIEFGAVTEPGAGYTLSADGATSVEFRVGGDFYQQLRSDALAFFYHQRSGIPIVAELVGEDYARPAGHVGVAPNKGDLSVPCQPGVCDYELDVRGGWYDAGDHGKYVVNGGIAVHQLMSEFERAKRVPGANVAALSDGALRVPEQGNGVPDILDEARWELEFLLRMQVPASEELAGMVHHKIHDNEWTGLPLLPHQDPKLRELHPVSTAATLNVAAVGAQCARVFAAYDAEFAQKCLSAARTAFAAAQEHPRNYASPSDGSGGGAYADDNVTDEFYWAAAELYLTTGEQRYLDYVLSSPQHTADVFTAGGFSWGSVAALGRLDLATIPSGLPDRERVIASVVDGADEYLAAARTQAFGVPYAPPDGFYVWGSNSQVLNNMVVLATAYDLTGEDKYRDAVLGGMDYLLGRNPLNQSYITGYGERDSHNQHHRFWADQVDPSLPNPPPGSIAGGPNSAIQDPVAQEKLAGCPAAMCYIDDIGSWSTNEVTINWNSALAWVSAFVADQTEPPARASCSVRYATSAEWETGFIGKVTVTNTGAAAVRGWTASWAWTAGQHLEHGWLSQLNQTGSWVSATDVGWNEVIEPGESVTFGFHGSKGADNPAPQRVSLNGTTCSMK